MKKRILIVEDEEPIAKMIAMNLRIANMDTVVFHDGLKAEESLKNDSRFDLAILDIMVPGKDGFALLEIMKDYGIPVIFLTAKDDIASKLQGLTDGAEDYMVKPFEILELLVRIDKIISRSKKKSDCIIVKDIDINPDERTVRKNGNEIPLKRMEFDLLVLLAKNKNIAISRNDLLSLVWGANYLGETRTVDVHIGQLRKKLDFHDCIKTVPKVGYRLEDTD